MPNVGLLGRRRRAARNDETGAIALIAALTLTLILLAAALVIDFGIVRVDRQIHKSAADAATDAGTHALTSIDDTPHPYVGVCTAMRYLQTNNAKFANVDTGVWTNGAGASVGSGNVGCTDTALQDATCTPGTIASWARYNWAASDGRLQVSIQSGYELAGSGWSDENLPTVNADNSDGQQGCNQLAVIITQSRKPGFGSLATSSDIQSSIRTVGRVIINPPKAAVALLLLERTKCYTLQVGSAAGTGRIEVLGAGTSPGTVHADSDGSDCNPSQVVMDGKKPAGIVAHPAETGGTPGSITLVASGANAYDSAANVYAGPAPGTPPTQRSLVGRGVVDEIFLTPVRNAVSAANGVFTSPLATLIAAGYTEISAGECNDAAAPDWAATKVYANCTGFNTSVDIPNATDIIFTDSLSSASLKMPKATRVYIRGQTGTAVTANAFEMNNGTYNAPCATGVTPTATRAQLFIYAGSIKSTGGPIRLCNTSLIMMSGEAGGCVPGSLNTYLDAPCPNPTNDDAGIDFTGGANLDWTAPNLSGVVATAAESADLEDIAVWAEARTEYKIGGGGFLHLSGLFMLPNADPLTLGGSGGQDLKDSQYVVRRLSQNGGAVMTMQPTSALPIKLPDLSYALVR